MTTLGRVALYLVFALTVYAAVAGVLAGRRGDRRLMRSSRNAFTAALGATLVAVVAVEYALCDARLLAGGRRRAHQPAVAGRLHAELALGERGRARSFCGSRS